MAKSYDFIIVGGGIIGLLTARDLCLEGFTVAIIERQQLGSESSGAGGGILSPLYPWREPEAIHPLARYGQQVYPQLSKELKEETGLDPECLHSGYIVLDLDETVTGIEFAKTHQVNFELIHHEIIKEKLAGLNIKNNSLFFPDVHQITPPKLVAAIKKWLIENKVDIFENSPVNEIIVENDIALGVKVENKKFVSEHVVITTGAWTEPLLRKLNLSINIQPVKGQIIVYDTPPQLLTNIVIKDGHYLIPRKNGEILVGSTVEYVGYEKEITKQALHELKQSAENILPALKNYKIKKQWAGLRPGNASGIPTITTACKIKNLSISAGHFRNGILLAPASAQLLVSQLLKSPLPFPVNPELYLLR